LKEANKVSNKNWKHLFVIIFGYFNISLNYILKFLILFTFKSLW
jgi:hypothetical protein